MERTPYLASLIGKRWDAQGKGPDTYSCWSLAREIEKVLWDRDLPDVDFPVNPTLRWMLETIASHPEQAKWVDHGSCHGPISANDGAIVLMGRVDRPAHIGVWLKPEGGIIHADQMCGVCFESPAILKVKGWGRLHFYEPIRE